MVKVYQPGQVQNNPLPGSRFTANATAASFGGGQAQDLQAMGGALMKAGQASATLHDISQERANRAAVRDKLNTASAELRELTGSYYRRKGQDAASVYSEAEQALAEVRKKHTQDIKDPRQKDMFDASYESLANGHLNRVYAFQEEQRVVWEKETREAENMNAIEDAAAAWTDPAAIREAEVTLKFNTAANLKGMGDKVIKKGIEDATHLLHTEVLKKVGAYSPQAALDYIKTYGDRIKPVERAVLTQELQKKADIVWAMDKALELANSGKTFEEQLAVADAEKDPNKATELKENLRSIRTDRENAKKEAALARYEEEVDALWKDPKNYKVPMDLNASTQTALYNLQRKFKTDGGVSAIATDWDVYYRLKSMPLTEFKNVDLLKYKDSLNATELKELMKDQTARGDKAGKTSGLRTSYQTAVASVKNMKDFSESTKLSAAKLQENGARRQQFFSAFETQLAKIPVEERTEQKELEIIKALLAPVMDRGNKYNPMDNKTVYRFEVPFMEAKQLQAFKTAAEAMENLPANLVGTIGAQFDPDEQVYFVEGANAVKVYDVYGNHVETWRKK